MVKISRPMGASKRAKWILPTLVVCIFILGMNRVAEAAPIIWNFTGSGSEGSVGNERTFTAGGITVTANAWSYGTSFQEARLGQWSTGVAVCGVPESCSNPAHQVDNVGQHEFVLFHFDAPVDPLTVRIDPYGTFDRDVSYWVGNVGSSIDGFLTGKEYGNLEGLGFIATRFDSDGTVSSSSRDVSINGPSSVNALLFGAQHFEANDAYADRFKITKVSGNAVPVPGTLLMFGVGFALFIGWHVRSRRRSSPLIA